MKQYRIVRRFVARGWQWCGHVVDRGVFVGQRQQLDTMWRVAVRHRSALKIPCRWYGAIIGLCKVGEARLGNDVKPYSGFVRHSQRKSSK